MVRVLDARCGLQSFLMIHLVELHLSVLRHVALRFWLADHHDLRRVELSFVSDVHLLPLLLLLMIRVKDLMMFSERVSRVVPLVRPSWRSCLAASYRLIVPFCFVRLCLTT